MGKQWRQVSLQKRREPVGKAARYLKGLNRKEGPRKEQRRWPLVMGKDGRLSKRDQNNVGKPFQGKGLPGKTMPWAPAWKGIAHWEVGWGPWGLEPWGYVVL